MSVDAKPEVQKDASMLKQKEMIAGNYDKLTNAKELGLKISSTFVPGNLNELTRCFDIVNNLPEINALNNAMRKQSGAMISDAEKMGHSEDVCTYVKADIGMMARGQYCAQRQANAGARHAAIVLHRLLHLPQMVRTAARGIQVPDGHAARTL